MTAQRFTDAELDAIEAASKRRNSADNTVSCLAAELRTTRQQLAAAHVVLEHRAFLAEDANGTTVEVVRVDTIARALSDPNPEDAPPKLMQSRWPKAVGNDTVDLTLEPDPNPEDES